jgi:hypothetical protein
MSLTAFVRASKRSLRHSRQENFHGEIDYHSE